VSNKLKLSNQKAVKRISLKKVPIPTRIGFLAHLGDTAGCGHIRIIFPYLLLNNIIAKDIKFEAFYTNRYTPHPEAYSQVTFAVFQRSATPDQLNMVRHLRSVRKNTSIIYEIDDNLFDIPDSNFAKPFYVKNKETAEKILQTVDGIITSTDFLKEEYSKYNKNIQVVPNHLPKFLWGDAEFRHQENKKPRIMYAGSMNHFSLTKNSDEGDFGTKLINFILSTTDKYEWHFVGGIPQRALVEARNTGKIKYHDWQTIFALPSYLRSMNVDLALAPLEENRFNMSKSNIKALESTILGIPVVCSDFGPYKGLSGAVKTSDEMISKIEELVSDVDKRQKQWYDTYNILKSQLFWEEDDNLTKFVNSYLRLVKMTL